MFRVIGPELSPSCSVIQSGWKTYVGCRKVVALGDFQVEFLDVGETGYNSRGASLGLLTVKHQLRFGNIFARLALRRMRRRRATGAVGRWRVGRSSAIRVATVHGILRKFRVPFLLPSKRSWLLGGNETGQPRCPEKLIAQWSQTDAMFLFPDR